MKNFEYRGYHYGIKYQTFDRLEALDWVKRGWFVQYRVYWEGKIQLGGWVIFPPKKLPKYDKS